MYYMKCCSSDLRGQHFAFYYTVIKVQRRPFPIHMGFLYQASIISAELSADVNYAQTGNVLPFGAGLDGVINVRLLPQHVLRLSTAMYGHGPL